MARTSIATLAVGRDNVQPALTALTVADGGAFSLTGHDILKLTSSGAATVTIPTNTRQQVDGESVPIVRTITMGAGETHYARFDGTPFVQPDGTVHVDVSATGVCALVIRPAFVDVGFTG